MGKTNVNMICDVAELSSLFEKSSGLDDFLQAAVSTVAYHMQAAVCSIYIYDDASRTLRLRATQGLEPEAIGNVELRLGQGIAGMALKELRSICVGRATESRDFYAIDGIGEEKYEAFLAVPIRRQLKRVGVLTVQDPQANYFDSSDEQALRAIAGQLATVIENAGLLMALHQKSEKKSVKTATGSRLVKGRPGSAGIARGHGSFVVAGRSGKFRRFEATPDHLTLEDFERALTASEQQLSELQRKTAEDLSDVAQLIFNAHLLILADDEFSGTIRRKIVDGEHPADALVEVVNRYIDIFSASPNPRLKEKVHDLKDLGHRLMENLVGGTRAPGDYSGHIILADELLPSDVLKLATENAEGFIVQGGMTSHIAIICRSLQKPMVMVDAQQFDLFDGVSDLLMDGSAGTVYIQPSDEILAEYAKYQRRADALAAALPMKPESYTADGTRIQIFANINLLSDLKLADEFRAEGVGLYRSEFPFIIRNDFPSEEEQYRVYKRIVESMGQREVTFRALDIGGDKLLSYQDEVEEANPFLGLRGIRFLLRNKDVFTEQLRAMLRAGAGGNSRIMFPLIASVDEFVEAKELVLQCMKELDGRGVEYNRDTKLGIMVELPSAVTLVEDLAHEVDFMSIGTNDLIQYTLAVDRTNEMVSKLYLAHHPAILRAIDRVVSVARSHRKDVSICGDIARDAKMIPFLLGVGIRKLSLSPRQMFEIQQAVEAVSMEKAVYAARQMLELSRISEMEEFLKNT
ncbi:phosphoenolpyruvate--protein phosphotransferase [Tichowtungia aerotolerans]|uniref:phosphoenolpyruvate--protein phosphotransferase n=1 Tax=Tichowtungia aerotolerans TaxID=2697043 RepID=A0A6P1M6D2_9BACT|nr:phosphoenolpyruvate--protein phosphotransferase [Tichowtungia aerotolerans]QHI68563.1 phosphoenolpyruvate--protein phosphotransferase [Tichowtungia aerotolerans]